MSIALSLLVVRVASVEQQRRISRCDGFGVRLGQSQRRRKGDDGLRAIDIRGNAAQAYTSSFFFIGRAVEGDLRPVRRVIDRVNIDAQL